MQPLNETEIETLSRILHMNENTFEELAMSRDKEICKKENKKQN